MVTVLDNNIVREDMETRIDLCPKPGMVPEPTQKDQIFANNLSMIMNNSEQGGAAREKTGPMTQISEENIESLNKLVD